MPSMTCEVKSISVTSLGEVRLVLREKIRGFCNFRGIEET